MTESFKNNKYILEVFTDLSKVFETVDHFILLKKLEPNGITDRNHESVKSYLSNRRQFIQIDKKEKNKLRHDLFWCSTRLKPLLGPLLFLLYVNELKKMLEIYWTD